MIAIAMKNYSKPGGRFEYDPSSATDMKRAQDLANANAPTPTVGLHPRAVQLADRVAVVNGLLRGTLHRLIGGLEDTDVAGSEVKGASSHGEIMQYLNEQFSDLEKYVEQIREIVG